MAERRIVQVSPKYATPQDRYWVIQEYRYPQGWVEASEYFSSKFEASQELANW